MEYDILLKYGDLSLLFPYLQVHKTHKLTLFKLTFSRYKIKAQIFKSVLWIKDIFVNLV